MGTPGPAPGIGPDEALEVFATLEQPSTPLTAFEVAETLGCSRRTARRTLERLHDRGTLATKETAAHDRVWWWPASARNDATDADPDGPSELAEFGDFVSEVEDYAIFALDPDGTVATWNEGARRIKGYQESEIVGRHFSTFYTEEAVETGVPADNLAAAREDGRVEDEGWRVRADGSEFWANVVITAIRGDDGDLRGFTKVTRDMTERREYEQRLQRERERTEKLLRTAPIPIAVVDEAGDAVVANERAQEALGLTQDEIVEGPENDAEWTIYGGDGEPIEAHETPSARVLETGEPVYDAEVAVENPAGERTWFSINAAPFSGPEGNQDRVVVAGEDVTRLKERERELESELSEVFGRVSDAFYALDDEWRFTHVNDAATSVLEHSREELLGESVWDVFPEVADSHFRDQFEAAFETQEPRDFEEYYENGDRWLRFNVYPSETGLSVYFRDVTDRKERQRELARYETIVETVNDGIYVVDEDGRFTMVNEAYAEMTGYDREALLGEHVSLVVDGAVRREAKALEADLSEGAVERPVVEAELDTASGDRIPAEATFSVLARPGAGRHRIGVVRDISERKEYERELERSERRYRTLVENFPNGAVALVDDELRYRTVGGEPIDAESEVASDLEGKTVREAIEPELADVVEPRYRAALDGESSTFEVEQEGRISQIQIYPVRDDDGEVFAAMGMSQDITERVERERYLEDAKSRLEAATEAGAIGTLEWDIQADELVASRSFADTCGLDPDAVMDGVSLERFVSRIHEDDRERVERQIEEAVETCGEYEAEYRVRDANGDLRWVVARGHVETDEDGNPSTFPGALTDITERKEYQRRIEESERRYRTLVENFPDGAVGLFDEELRYTALGGQLMEEAGVPHEERIGHSVQEIYPDEIAEEALPYFRAALDGEVHSFETEYHDRHLLAHTLPVRNGDDEVFAGMLVVQDVTDRKEYERELEDRARQQRAVSEIGQLALESADIDGIMDEAARRVADVLDNDYCKVLDMDDAGEALLLRQGVGWREGLVGSATVGAHETDSQAGFTLRSDEPVVVEDLESDDRFCGPELLTAHDVSSGISTIIGSRDDPWGILGTHDTERRSFGEEDVDFVRSVSNVLAGAIERHRYQHELEELVDRLEESNERLERFAYVASHDLQEPLRMISNYLQLLERRYRDELDSDAEEFIDFAVDGAERMRDMIDDLLAYSRLDTEADPFEPIDVETVVENVRDDLQLRIEETDARITVGDLPTVEADENQLEMVIQNLVSNAIKYSGDDPPRIEIGADRRDDEWVFSVADDGIGMDPDNADDVFDVFERLHSHDEYPGTGIGLAMCRKIVRHHGGRIRVESEPDEGSTFYFTVPADERRTADTGPVTGTGHVPPDAGERGTDR